MKSLAKARGEFRHAVYLMGGFSLIVNMLLLVMPLYMLQIYDRVLPSRSLDTLTFLSLIAVGSLVVLGLLEAVRAILASRAAARLEANLGADALRLTMRRSSLGETDIQPVRDLSMVKSFISSRGLFSFLDLPFAPLFIGILYFLHPTLFYLTLGGAVVLFALALLNQWVTAKYSAQSNQSQSLAMGTAQSLARNTETLRAMGMVGSGISLWGQHNAQSLNAQGRVDGRNAVLTGFSKTLRMGLQIAILGVGAWLVLQNEMTAGMIFAASIISGRGLQPIDQVIGGWKQFASTLRAWRNLSLALDQANDEIERTHMPKPKGQIDVSAALVVSPAGMSRPPILNRVSFSLNPGDVLGIVGPSGSGKSTLARMLVGSQSPDAGNVRIDGTDIPNWDPAQLGSNIGYVGQITELLPGTIKENIARLASAPDDSAVLEAAQRAQVHELIQSLPNGYDTQVGPGGTGLSGGQRQRIALARAFYGNPQIMVLDEPNANLDEDGEMALHRALLLARQSGVTVIVITQRKQVLAVVSKILRLHQGNLDFFGTQQEFVERLKAVRERSQASQAQKHAQAGKPERREMPRGALTQTAKEV